MAEAAAIASRSRRNRGDDLEGRERDDDAEGGHQHHDDDNGDDGSGRAPASKRRTGGPPLRWRKDEALRVERLLGRSQSTLEKKFKQYQVQ